jgi:N-hydroxyarylamine O-acetyltransferase
VFDLAAYLERIGLSGRPSLAEVHFAHSVAIPFENLDPRAGRPVSLAIEDLQNKLVYEGRGGYCFEQNLLLGAALEALGYEVELFLARARKGAAPGTIRPRSHLLLRVQADGQSWHADVGYGLGTPFEPLPFGAGAEHEQLGWSFRIVEEHPELVLQAEENGEWVDLYGFLPHPVPPIDVETINWWVSTHPRSPFVTGLMVGAQSREGTRVSLRDAGGLALREHAPGHSAVMSVDWAAVPELLATSFGIEGFFLDGNARLRQISPARQRSPLNSGSDAGARS